MVQLWSGAAAAADFDAAGEFGQAAVLTGMPLQDLMGHIGGLRCSILNQQRLELAAPGAACRHGRGGGEPHPASPASPGFALPPPAGMGHIFLEVATPEGALYGAWEESTADGEPMAKPAADAHAGHAEPAMAAADKHAGHAQPAETAAKEDGHAGHAHRRLLFL